MLKKATESTEVHRYTLGTAVTTAVQLPATATLRGKLSLGLACPHSPTGLPSKAGRRGGGGVPGRTGLWLWRWRTGRGGRWPRDLDELGLEEVSERGGQRRKVGILNVLL